MKKRIISFCDEDYVYGYRELRELSLGESEGRAHEKREWEVALRTSSPEAFESYMRTRAEYFSSRFDHGMTEEALGEECLNIRMLLTAIFAPIFNAGGRSLPRIEVEVFEKELKGSGQRPEFLQGALAALDERWFALFRSARRGFDLDAGAMRIVSALSFSLVRTLEKRLAIEVPTPRETGRKFPLFPGGKPDDTPKKVLALQYYKDKEFLRRALANVPVGGERSIICPRISFS
ncbi:MAG: hypothetical protein AAB495_02960 [Patescibacteria group bacterium]